MLMTQTLLKQTHDPDICSCFTIKNPPVCLQKVTRVVIDFKNISLFLFYKLRVNHHVPWKELIIHSGC